MALQDPNVLSMVALATLGDVPPHALQPKLVDAIHLRWAFRPDIGFPWHGFYLYRRPSTGKQLRCLRNALASAPPGSISGTAWASGIGTVASDHPLATRDDFPPAGTVELDLSGREYLEFLPLSVAFAAQVEIGIRAGAQIQGRYLSFSAMRPQLISNAYAHLGISVLTLDRDGNPNPTNEIVQVSMGGSEGSALLVGAKTAITIDEPIAIADIALIGPEKVSVTAVDGSGAQIAGHLASPPGSPVQHYRVVGHGIRQITLELEGTAFLQSVAVNGPGLTPFIELSVTAYSGADPILQTTVSGKPGEVVSTTLKADTIDRIRIAGGPASLIDLCWDSVLEDALKEWRPVQGLTQPIALPVRHPDYPASGNLPTDIDLSRAEALGRISYGDPNAWTVPFADLHAQCLQLVKGGPAIPMNAPSRAETFPPVPDPGDTSPPPTIPSQQPLQLVLMAATHAPIAQMLGLYWSDKTAVAGQTYDYLIVADHDGKAGHDPFKVLSRVQSEGFTQLDGFIVFEQRLEKAKPLDPPGDARVFALPGSTRPGALDVIADASCNAGLRWYLPTVSSVLLPESPIFYHLWRCAYGETQPAGAAPASKFTPLDPENPLLIVDNLLSLNGVQRPPDWPPFSIYGFDNGVAEGWYGYRISSVDIFGRHSPLGLGARWFEWAPRPDPTPWYYREPPSDTAVHPFAIDLLDKVPPPPPTGTEAYALDPDDPYLQRDSAYAAWFASLTSAEQALVVGLRVRWIWTAAHMRQAPDTHEFRIYYQDGRLNSLLGRTTTTTAASATETLVETDISNPQPADAFTGCSLKIGSSLFSIVGSDPGTPLRVRVKNLGPLNDTRPPPNSRCAINVPNNHPLFVNYGNAHAWEARYYVVGYDEHVTVGVDAAGRPLRSYEVLLPASGDSLRGGLPLQPDLAEPIRFAAIGVTAADGRPHSPDDPKWSAGRFGNRPGNESTVSPPALVYRVLRAKPEPPAPPPPDSDKVFATPADYHGASFYSFRWATRPHLTAHVYRAMDDTIFTVDWSYQLRPPISASDPGIFPSEATEPRWNQAKREEVAAELNALRALPKTPAGKAQAAALYRALSNDALRVLANLPGNEEAFAQITVSPLDPDDPATANRVGPDNPPDFVVDPALRIFVDTLDGRSNNRFFYRACYLDGAQNRSALGISGPPIYLPNVVPTKPPTVTKALAGAANSADAGDNKITLRWASNREADLAEYRIYRTFDETDARSIRSMDLVQQVAVPPGDPVARPAENVWTDADVPALRWTYYAMTALDTAGNESPPGRLVKARAYDEGLPPVPALSVAWLATPPNLARAEWTATTDTRLERRAATELVWESASDWLPAGSHVIDDSIDEHFPWKYRVRARKATGAIAVSSVTNLLRK